MSWDKRYRKRVKEAGVQMPLYKRYVDDSNQVGRVPSEGSNYNADTKRVDVDDNEAELRRGEEPDTRLARVLKDIANDVQAGIELEEDHPSKNQDGMMPILDMKVKITEDGMIVYKHYEKEVSSQKVMHARDRPIWVQPIPIPIPIYVPGRYFCRYRYRYIGTDISATDTDTDIFP